jgi:hypothetical protein
MFGIARAVCPGDDEERGMGERAKRQKYHTLRVESSGKQG